MGGFEEVEHAADYALRVWGSDLRELVESAGRALIWLLVEETEASPVRWEEYRVEASDGAALVLHALREVLYLVEQGQAPVAFEVMEAREQPFGARCRVGLAAEGSGAAVVRQPKAVTYHDLEIRQGAGGLEMTITFDA